MLLVAHIIVALLSLLHAAFTYISPTKTKLLGAYVLTGLTLGSGTWIIMGTSGHMAEACMTGVIYLGVISLGITAAHRKLASESVHPKKP